MMTARPFTAEDHPTIAWWWEVRDFAAIPVKMLPPDGVVVCEDGKPVAACFLYLGPTFGGTAGWAEWMVTMPGLSPKKALAALEIALNEIILLAKRKQAVFLFTSLRNRGLGKLYRRAGFVQTDSEMTNFIRRMEA